MRAGFWSPKKGSNLSLPLTLLGILVHDFISLNLNVPIFKMRLIPGPQRSAVPMRCGQLFSAPAAHWAHLFLYSSACVPWNSESSLQVLGFAWALPPTRSACGLSPSFWERRFKWEAEYAIPTPTPPCACPIAGSQSPAGFKADSNLLLHFPSAPARIPILPNPPSLYRGWFVFTTLVSLFVFPLPSQASSLHHPRSSTPLSSPSLVQPP